MNSPSLDILKLKVIEFLRAMVYFLQELIQGSPVNCVIQEKIDDHK